jgi:hypothetical protein cdivTM_03523
MAANLLIHIPHASLCLPPDFWRDVMVGREVIKYNLRFMADYKVDELARDIDCHKVTARYSRLYCDVERFRNDADEPMARLGMGAVYTHLPGGAQYRQVTSERREEIIRQAYEPHHVQLNKLSQKIVAQYGSCMMIDLHSYSNDLVRKVFGYTENLPDICLGYDDEWFSGNDALKLKSYIEQLGYSCALNYPYAGALVPMDFYRDRTPGLRSVMLEINRRVYLEGETVREESVSDISKIIKFIASDNFNRSNS